MTDPNLLQRAILGIAAGVAAIAAVYDWRKGEVPSWLTHSVLLGAPFLHVAGHVLLAKEPIDTALQEGAYSLGGAALCAVVPMLLFRQGAMGGGDVKLLAAIGAILQPMVGVEAQMYGLFAGAILAPAVLAYQGKLFSTLKNSFAIGANLFLPKTRQRTIDSSALSWFRLGPAIFVGVMATAYLHW
jgi:prepilin peptidase CpaA